MHALYLHSIDFVTDLPATPRGWDAILILTCHFTKMVRIALCKSDYRPLYVARALFAWVFRMYGYPSVLGAERDSAFPEGTAPVRDQHPWGSRTGVTPRPVLLKPRPVAYDPT